MNWSMVIDLLMEMAYNFVNSLSGYMLGAKVLGWPEPAAWLLAGCFGVAGMANHWRALRKVVLVGALVGLAGCATVQQDVAKAVSDLSTFTQADLDQAIAMAAVAKDAEAPYRARCYTTLKKYVPSGATVGQALLPTGAISAFEKVAELDQQARAGVGLPQDLRADCSIILISAQEFALRLGVKFAPVPGTAAVGGLLK